MAGSHVHAWANKRIINLHDEIHVLRHTRNSGHHQVFVVVTDSRAITQFDWLPFTFFGNQRVAPHIKTTAAFGRRLTSHNLSVRFHTHDFAQVAHIDFLFI